MQELVDLGFNQSLQAHLLNDEYKDFEIGRVVIEHKERYVVRTANGIFQAEITGNLRYSSTNSADFPAVGDWVCLTVFDKDQAIIVKILPRFSILQRQATGKTSSVQIIASNIDYAFIVQAIGHDFNLNRLERYISLCKAAGIIPIIVFSKIDLIDNAALEEIQRSIQNRINDYTTVFLSNESLVGLAEIKALIEDGKTYCFLGSSGVGKSSLVNNLLSEQVMEIKEISDSTSKGKHTTSHRELFVLESGGVIIDTPGMRELGLSDSKESLALTFDEIQDLTQNCKFSDCSHTVEKGCAVLEAVEDGRLDEDQLNNYQKLIREQAHYESSVKEKRDKDKQFGKIVKSFVNEKRKNK